jgi:hypothetical protein
MPCRWAPLWDPSRWSRGSARRRKVGRRFGLAPRRPSRTDRNRCPRPWYTWFMANPNQATSLRAWLSQVSPESLRADLARVEGEIEQLQAERDLIQLALRRLDARTPMSTEAGNKGNVSEDTLVEGSQEDVLIQGRLSDEIEVHLPKRATRNRVLALIERDPNRTWTPIEVWEGLRNVGVDAKRDSIRVMLQRLHSSGLLERPKTGHYKLAEQNHRTQGGANRTATAESWSAKPSEE